MTWEPLGVVQLFALENNLGVLSYRWSAFAGRFLLHEA
jgi:hypothetical protein